MASNQAVSPEIEAEVKIMRDMEKEIAQLQAKHQTLTSQLNENNMVKAEMDILDDSAKIYKMVGPVLVLQEFSAAKDNVAKRLEYIEKDVKRVDNLVATKTKNAQDLSAKIMGMQRALQEKMQAQAAAMQ
jgi:prefoldin beta subunit|tara:strand:+ start:117 stop:506 length:390 start_codon:yes stop_codon:yes gene_type:complete|eukprot:g6313.t1